MLKTVTIRATIAAILAGLSMSAHAIADTQRIDIPAGSLLTALETLAKQANVDLVYQDAQVKGLQTGGVIGELSPHDAVVKLLQGTPLKVRRDEASGAILIMVPASGPPATSSLSLEGRGTKGEGSRAGGQETKSFWSRLRLAQADTPSTSQVDTQKPSPSKGEGQGEDAERTQSPNVTELEEIVVTGSHIRGSAAAGSKVIVVGRDEIDSGYGKLQDFIETIPQNFTGISEDFSQSNTANHTRSNEIQLRGLGPGTTLTLINGQRPAAGGILGAFTDISSIPTSAIERVEILPDGASAIYGSDAIGGVVNIVLRDDLDGAQTAVRMGTADGESDDIQLSQLVGTRWETGHALIGYQYSKREALHYGSREYLAANGDLRPFGGSDRRRDAVRRGAAPGNIVSSSGAVLFAIPSGQDGTALTAADLIPNQTNYFDASEATILPQQEIHSAFLRATQSLGERVNIDFGAWFAERDSEVLIPGSLATVSVPAANPFNPLRAPVRVEYDFSRDFGGFPRDLGHTKTYAADVVTTIGLTDRWNLRVSAAYGEESVLHTRTNQRDSVAIAAALRDTNPATALNVFGDGTANNPATIAAIRLDRIDDTTSQIASASMIADGPLFRINEREARLAIGVDHRHDRYRLKSNSEIDGETRDERKVSAAFAELALPLLDSAAGSGLELSLAGRFDDYDDFGSTFNPKVGLSWQPVELVTLRGTWGTAFRAPPFYLSNEVIRPPGPSVSTLTDPTSPTGRTTVLGRFGVKPGLKEETAEVWTAGLDITPFDNLDVSLSYFDIAYTDRIQPGVAVPSTILVFESQLAGTDVIIRNPTQAQIDEICTPEFVADCGSGPYGAIVDFRMRNIAEVNVSGLDLSTRYSLNTSFGTLHFGLGGTYTFNYEEAVTDGAQRVDFIDTLERPLSLRLRGTLGWALRGWHARSSVSYAGDYEDPASGRPISSWTRVDVSAGYDFSPETRWLAGLSALVAATNVFDKAPPFVDKVLAFDGANSSIIGRTVSVQVVKRW